MRFLHAASTPRSRPHCALPVGSAALPEMSDRARARTLSGPEWTPGTTQATYLTKVLDLAWTEELYGGTLVLKVTKNRDMSIVTAGVYKKDNGTAEEVLIGADLDVYRLIGLYIAAPQMFNTELTGGWWPCRRPPPDVWGRTSPAMREGLPGGPRGTV